MTPQDTAAFSDALKAGFPNIRFVSLDYWRPFVDWPRFKEDCRQNERRWKQRLPRPPVVYHLRDLAGEPLHYWDSLAHRAETDFQAWIEPPGWRPEWGPPDWQGVRELENMPALEFTFRRSHFEFLGPKRWHSFNDEPVALNGRETIVLHGTTFEVRWNRYDTDGEAFGKNVFKILRKLTVDLFINVDRETRKAWSDKPARMPSYCLAGHHADAWTLKRKHNYLAEDGGPLMKSARYRFRRAEIFTDAELAQRRAREEAWLVERVKQLKEESAQRVRENSRQSS